MSVKIDANGRRSCSAVGGPEHRRADSLAARTRATTRDAGDQRALRVRAAVRSGGHVGAVRWRSHAVSAVIAGNGAAGTLSGRRPGLGGLCVVRHSRGLVAGIANHSQRERRSARRESILIIFYPDLVGFTRIWSESAEAVPGSGFRVPSSRRGGYPREPRPTTIRDRST